MRNDVERLVQMLLAECGGWMTPERARRTAERLLGNGVTLPTPPRATPLEAAAAKLRELDDANGPVWPDYEKPAAEVIAAAVGALSDEDVRQIGQAYVSTPYRTRAADRTRAALLARLTEGGTA